MLIKIAKVEHIVGKDGNKYDVRCLSETTLIPESTEERDAIIAFVCAHVPTVDLSDDEETSDLTEEESIGRPPEY